MKAKSITKKKKEKSNTNTHYHPYRLSREAASFVSRKAHSKYARSRREEDARSRREEDEGQGNELWNLSKKIKQEKKIRNHPFFRKNSLVNDMISGKSTNAHQRFEICKLALNPTGKEGRWTQVMINTPTPKITAQHAILYHASIDKRLMSAQIGSTLRTEGPTWHHTIHSWDFFMRHKRRIIAEIHVPSKILVDAIKSQNTPPANLGDRIKLAKLRESSLYEKHKNPIVFTGNKPIITSFCIDSTLTPFYIENGRSYATVVMPPFYAKVVNITQSNNNKKPDRIKMVFLKFVSAENRSLGQLVNPMTLNALNKMIENSKNDGISNMLLRQRKKLIRHMYALPNNFNNTQIETLVNNLKKFNNPKAPVANVRHLLSNNLQHMIDHGHNNYGNQVSKVSNLISALERFLNPKKFM